LRGGRLKHRRLILGGHSTREEWLDIVHCHSWLRCGFRSWWLYIHLWCWFIVISFILRIATLTRIWFLVLTTIFIITTYLTLVPFALGHSLLKIVPGLGGNDPLVDFNCVTLVNAL